MSRVGKNPVTVPNGVTVELGGDEIMVKGAKGALRQTVSDVVEVSLDDGAVVVKPRSESQHARAMWGTTRSLIQSMVTGVSEGFTRHLDINGTGYRAQVQGNTLQLQLGYSHDVQFPIPDGISIACERPTTIEITGADKQQVGQVAAVIRGYRPPEPYKGKGIKYREEIILRKEGKKK